MSEDPQHRARRPGIVSTILGMSGFVVEHMTPTRLAFNAGSFVTVGLLPRTSVTLALWYFVVATAVHYIYLFGMFAPGGWSRKVRGRWGEEPGYLLHEGWLSFIFCHTGLSIAFLCATTRGLPLLGFTVPQIAPAFRLIITGLLMTVGFGMKAWATMLVSMDSYYYRALFTERAGGTFQAIGPYRWFRDPMYTVGHLQAYGLAIWYGSLWGLVAVVLNQALVLTFNALVEQPATRRIFGTVDASLRFGKPETMESQP